MDDDSLILFFFFFLTPGMDDNSYFAPLFW
jgi:hypothetical protein